MTKYEAMEKLDRLRAVLMELPENADVGSMRAWEYAINNDLEVMLKPPVVPECETENCVVNDVHLHYYRRPDVEFWWVED